MQYEANPCLDCVFKTTWYMVYRELVSAFCRLSLSFLTAGVDYRPWACLARLGQLQGERKKRGQCTRAYAPRRTLIIDRHQSLYYCPATTTCRIRTFRQGGFTRTTYQLLLRKPHLVITIPALIRRMKPSVDCASRHATKWRR